MPIHFYVDPATNYSDPDARMAYGLHVVSPWGGTVFITFPNPSSTCRNTRHRPASRRTRHRLADKGWGESAHYEAESLSEPGVFFRAEARAEGARVHFLFCIRNETRSRLASISLVLS